MTRNFAAKAVHKYMYPATYNFRDEADGTSRTDIGFVSIEASTHCEIITVEAGHRKVLRFFEYYI